MGGIDIYYHLFDIEQMEAEQSEQPELVTAARMDPATLSRIQKLAAEIEFNRLFPDHEEAAEIEVLTI